MKIQETDLISGRLYLELVNDYKKYDERQKKYIKELEARASTKDNKYVLKVINRLKEKGFKTRKQQYKCLKDLIDKYLCTDNTLKKD